MSDIVSDFTQTKLDGGLHFTEIAANGLMMYAVHTTVLAHYQSIGTCHCAHSTPRVV